MGKNTQSSDEGGCVDRNRPPPPGHGRDEIPAARRPPAVPMCATLRSEHARRRHPAGWGPMRRRDFITAIAGSTVARPLAARAQQQPIPIVGFVSNGSPDAARVAAFRKGLGETGAVEGQNVTVEYHWLMPRYATYQKLHVPSDCRFNSSTPARAAKSRRPSPPSCATKPTLFSSPPTDSSSAAASNLRRSRHI